MTEQLLPWLNGQIDLRVAYTFNYNTVVACLQDIVNNPGVYGVPPANVPDLVLIHQDITRLRYPDGAAYLVPAPAQNISRQANPRYPRAIASLTLVRSRYGDLDYWALPDLLGLFLSSLGLAPEGATKRNFYLPVTAVFGQWCSKLLLRDRYRCPRVYQCTWNTQREFALGASRGGYAVQGVEGNWLAVLDRARYGIVRSPLLTLANWSQAWTPTIRERGRARGTPFGRCGETYPFRRLLMSCQNQAAAQAVYGLALPNDYLSSAPVYDDRLSGNIWRKLWKPCSNCQALIDIYGGNINNFRQQAGGQGAPP